MTDYTQPERSTEIHKAKRGVKRYKAHVAKHGPCSVCKYRSLTETLWGRHICKIGQGRQHPTCMKDGKGLTFEFDASVMTQFQDKGE